MGDEKAIAIGYRAICTLLNLKVLPHFRESYIASQGRGKVIIDNHHETHIYPKIYALKNSNDLLENLEFALKYDGINLSIIKGLFEHVKQADIVTHIKKHPNGIYTRKIWYLYELLMDTKLAINNCHDVKYADLVDTKMYFTCQSIKSTRHAINDNLLGNKDFCPFVRRTGALEKYIALRLDESVKALLKKYDPYIISRASNYLYTKETMSSYQIEREQPDKNRLMKFVSLLQQAHTLETLSKEKLLELQNTIVDPRFKDVDYRQNQNYIGENVSPYFQKIHYISPKPEDVNDLMQGWFYSLDRMLEAKVHPVIIAAIVAFGFVFIHPFEDGNGRIHRFLIHYVLSKTEFTPKDMIFPVSSVMLKNIRDYDKTLEAFSKPLLDILTNYDLTDEGVMTVHQESLTLYQYADFTLMTEYLFFSLQETIKNDFEQEIIFLVNYDKAKQAIQHVVEMPDNKIDLLIRCVMQNNGKLSEQKRNRLFSLLTEDEVKRLTEIIHETMMQGENLRGIMAGVNITNIRDRQDRE